MSTMLVYISYMQLNSGTVAGLSGKDLNVEPAWMQGITGKGVVVIVFDKGMTIIKPHST